ncbi:TetR/AcrR family transcriptional regulator [Christensenellaceae bacterium OttesenSCG-928-M15]|nr:TetR/AcrR family transcriptional regulator [Christensenellaceae bacterium OttesenSCG-928-M15]
MEKPLKIPRQVKSQEVKDKIFQTAIDLIKNHGYEYVTVSNICNVANVSVGSFYHHFHNKDDLMAYYLVAGYEKYKAHYTQIETADIVKNIQQMYQLYINFCIEQGLPFLKNYYNTKNKGLDTRTHFSMGLVTALPIHQQAIVAIKKAQTAGYIRAEESAEDLSEELCTLEKGCMFDWCVSDGGFDLLALSDKMIRKYMLGALTAQYDLEFPQ